MVVNCAGPQSDLRRTEDPLLANLLAAGSAAPGFLGMGIDTDDDGRVRSADGKPHPTLWALGALRRGQLWKTTAIPEIRTQANAIADYLVAAPAFRGARTRGPIPTSPWRARRWH